MKVKRVSEVTQSCPTLRDPMDCSPPGSSVHGIFQARVLEAHLLVSNRHPSSPLRTLQGARVQIPGWGTEIPQDAQRKISRMEEPGRLQSMGS